MTQPAKRLSLDLAHPLARDAQLLADFFERVRVAIEQAVAKLQDTHFARLKGRQDV